jgi:ATP-dependent RNA helicase HelY
MDEQGERVLNQTRAIRDFAQRFRDGDVLRLSQDDEDRAVLLARGWGANPRMFLLKSDGETSRISAEQLDRGVALLGQMVLPEPVRTRDGGYRKSVARLLRQWVPDPRFTVAEFSTGGESGIAACAELGDHLAWVRRARKAETDVLRLRKRLERSDEGLVKTFRSLLALLAGWGYVRGWSLTGKGEQLRFVYNELDILLTEAISRGIFDEMTGVQMAATTSLFTYESRRLETEAAAPPGDIAEQTNEIDQLALELTKAERAAGLPETRLPDAGFAATAYAWAAGHDLDELFDDDLAAGDFVRNCRQLIDVMRQLRDQFPQLRAAAADGIRRVDRGVVAAGGRA